MDIIESERRNNERFWHVYAYWVGNVQLTAIDNNVPVYTSECFSANPDMVCPMSTGIEDSANGSVSDQTPVITGISPTFWQSGTTTTVTIDGYSFGTNSPRLAFAPAGGITYSLNSYSDTQVIANITVALGTPTENVVVTLTATGYSGNGFAPGQTGASPTSSGANARIVTGAAGPDITVIGWVDATQITLPSGANATLINDLTSGGVSCVRDVLSWAGLNPYDGNARHLTNTTDKNYAVYALVKNSANANPGSTINPTSTFAGGDYRAFNDVHDLPGRYKAGDTPNPCKGGIVPGFGVSADTKGLPNGPGTSPSGRVYQTVEVRIGATGQSVNYTLTGNTTPYVWAVIEVDANGNLIQVDRSVYPTFSVYQNGSIIPSQGSTQIDTGAFASRNASYKFDPTTIP